MCLTGHRVSIGIQTTLWDFMNTITNNSLRGLFIVLKSQGEF
jgi:hypothetical protein